VNQSANFLIGNRFHPAPRILGPEIYKQCLRVKRPKDLSKSS